jgi:hypothetical protein
MPDGIAPLKPSVAKTRFDDLRLPGGKLGETKSLVPLLVRLGIPGVANDTGRERAAEFYAAHLKSIHDHAGQKAVDAWLAANKGV